MGIAVRVADTWNHARHGWRVWLGLPRRASVALLILLALGIGEPLLCIFHCQVWLPIARRNYLATRTHHHHHAPTVGQPALPSLDPASTAPIQACFLQAGSGSDQPFHIPPSPVHEMALAAMPLLIVLPPLGIRRRMSLAHPQRIFPEPLLRPPQPVG